MNAKDAREIKSQFKDSLHIFDEVHPNAKAYFISEGYLECLEQVKPLVEALEEYVEHQSNCILSFWEGGEPIPGGGYREKYKGNWYQTLPIDERPKCNCGLAEALNRLWKFQGEEK